MIKHHSLPLLAPRWWSLGFHRSQNAQNQRLQSHPKIQQLLVDGCLSQLHKTLRKTSFYTLEIPSANTHIHFKNLRLNLCSKWVKEGDWLSSNHVENFRNSGFSHCVCCILHKRLQENELIKPMWPCFLRTKGLSYHFKVFEGDASIFIWSQEHELCSKID